MSRSSCSVPLQKRRRISRFSTLLSTENLACLVSKILSESQAFLAYSFFGQQFKFKPEIVLYSSTLKYQASASRGKIARKFNFMFAFSTCLYFRFKRIVEKLEMLRHFALERIEGVESVVKSTTNN